MTFSYKFAIAIIVSILSGGLVFFLGYKYSMGAFEQWQPLARLPEQVTGIAGTTMGSVTVKAISGKLYTCSIFAPDNCWTVTQEIPPDPASANFQCKAPKTSSDMLDIHESCYLDPGGEHAVIYALKADGNVYFKDMSTIFGERGWVVFLFCPLGLILGFIGTWIFFFFRWLRTIP